MPSGTKFTTIPALLGRLRPRTAGLVLGYEVRKAVPPAG